MPPSPDWPERYRVWSNQTFGKILPVFVPDIVGAFSFAPSSKYFNSIWKAIEAVELEIVDKYLKEIDDRCIEGEIAEFGIYQGLWINRFFDSLSRQHIAREIWGFDSFEGLSAPDSLRDSPGWTRGSYAASLDEVLENTKGRERTNIRFVPGWFSESLKSERARLLNKVAFARVDCDLYSSTADVLQFLSGRLTHGAILTFDDWPHNIDFGEARAFAEWVETERHLEFEFLFFSGWYHFYIRVWHRGQPRWESAVL